MMPSSREHCAEGLQEAVSRMFTLWDITHFGDDVIAVSGRGDR